MPTSDEDVRDDDETIINDQSGDVLQDGDGDKPDDSLKTSETSDPRAAFMAEFSEEHGSDEDNENEDDEDEQEDDVSADELSEDDDEAVDDGDDQTEEDSEETDEDEESDDDDDIGVDLEGITGIEEDDSDTEADFDPRQDLNKKVWKSTPKEAQQLITKFRRNYKKQTHAAETEKPFAEWSRSLLSDATQAGMQTEDLMSFIDVGLRAHRGDQAAIDALGSRMVQHGYAPEPATTDLSGVQDFLKTQVDSLEMDREVAVKLMELVNGTVGKTTQPAGKEAAAPAAPRQPETRQAPGYSSTELEAAALNKIEEMNARYADRFGEDWNKISKRVSRDVTLAMAENPVSPAQWANLWKKKADVQSAAFLKRSKASKKKSRRRLRSDSDSLGRGASIIAKESSGSEETGRAAFHKQHTR